MKDITNWGRSGYGGKSTLEKEELINPLSGERYLIKYPRKFNVGVSWEDITELVAAKIGNLLGLEMMEVEIVIRENRQGCLLKNFIPKGMMNEEGGALLSMFDSYAELLNSELEGEKLIKQGFALDRKS